MIDSPQPSMRRNLLLAVVLSALILLGFDAVSYFAFGKHAIGGWQPKTEVQTGPQTTQVDANRPQSGPQLDAKTAAVDLKPRRVTLSNNLVTAGYNVVGGKLDDLTLTAYQAKLGEPAGVRLLHADGDLATWMDSGWQGSGMATPDVNTVWQQSAGTGGSLMLEFKNTSGQTFQRTLTLLPNSYVVEVVDRVVNGANLPLSLKHYSRVNRVGGAAPDDHSTFVNYSGPMGAVASGEDVVTHEGHYSDIKDETRTPAVAGDGGWWGITGQYFMTAVVPTPGNGEVTRNFRYDAGGDVYSAAVTRDVTVPAAGQAEVRYKIYAGPKQEDLLEGVGQELERAIDWGWFAAIAKPLYRLLLWLHGWLGNWGLAILAITLILKLVTYPLANKSYKSMAKMKKLQPEIEKLRAETGGSQQEMAMKMMALYSREKVNPMGGCWPTLIQIPIFFAMYKVVLVAFEFRHAPLGLWVHDLSVMDPWYVLPVLMGGSMWVQMQLNPPAADPTQQMVFKWMPIMFTVMFLNFPAALVLYWLINNILSIGQQYWMMKKEHAI